MLLLSLQDKELALLRWLEQRKTSSAFDRAVLSVTNVSWGNDLSICVAMIGGLLLWKQTYRYYWTLVFGYVLFRVFLVILPGQRPCKVEYRLKPRLQTRGSGSVSALVLFGTIVFFELSRLDATPVVNGLCFLAVALCFYSRLLSMTHFPHQLMFSMLLGGVALTLTRAIGEKLPHISHNGKLICTFVGTGLLLAEVMLDLEQDQSQFRQLNLPTKEYIRVLDHIMSGDASTDVHAYNGNGSQRRAPTDSFVKLIRSMEKRSRQKL